MAEGSQASGPPRWLVWGVGGGRRRVSDRTKPCVESRFGFLELVIDVTLTVTVTVTKIATATRARPPYATTRTPPCRAQPWDGVCWYDSVTLSHVRRPSVAPRLTALYTCYLYLAHTIPKTRAC